MYSSFRQIINGEIILLMKMEQKKIIWHKYWISHRDKLNSRGRGQNCWGQFRELPLTAKCRERHFDTFLLFDIHIWTLSYFLTRFWHFWWEPLSLGMMILHLAFKISEWISWYILDIRKIVCFLPRFCFLFFWFLTYGNIILSSLSYIYCFSFIFPNIFFSF